MEDRPLHLAVREALAIKESSFSGEAGTEANQR